jgi:oxygen-dependent protoporphyrinogen oxidase
VWTHHDGAFRWEGGPHTFLSSADDLFELIGLLDLESALVQPKPTAKARFIVRDGGLHAAPSGLWSFLTTPLLSPRGKWALAGEPWRRGKSSPDDTAEQFFTRRFGAEAADILAGAFISGVYAGDAAQLSAPAAFPLFWGFEQEAGSMIRGAMRHQKRRKRALRQAGKPLRRGLFSFTEGLGQLTRTMAERLGPRCRLGVRVERLERGPEGYRVVGDGDELAARAVVVATPPQAAAAIVASWDSTLAHLLQGVPMAPMAVVHLGFDRPLGEIPDGFGFLAPRSQGIRTLGVLFPSRLFEDRAPESGDLLACFIGGMTDPRALELSDEQLAQLVRRDLMVLTQLSDPPLMVRVERYAQAVPQLVVGHLERRRMIDACLEGHGGLALAGNYLRGVGLKDAVTSGRAASRTIQQWLGGPPS